MKRIDPELQAHLEWLGLIQPVGLVVAPHALRRAQVAIDSTLRHKVLEYDVQLTAGENEARVLRDWRVLAREFLEWTPEYVPLVDGPALPDHLTVALPEFDDRLTPDAAVRDPHRSETWLLLIKQVTGDLDATTDTGWRASHQARFERLLRGTNIGAGLLISPHTIRLVVAPGGESSGYLSFPVASMATPQGRSMLFALYELLKGWRLSRACPREQGLRAILDASRKYQNEVSAELAEQVLGALYELTAGFQAADKRTANTVLRETLSNAPDELYGGLLTSIMRLVFVLYAEERGMLPDDASWVEHYGVGALFAQLQADRARYPDTMDDRFAAWPRLLSLWRILHDGAWHAGAPDDRGVKVPAREGDLFDPDRYPFLEGRPWATRRVMGERLSQVPRVSDGTVLRVLEQLLVLDGERLSYRALDIEQIGSVYEAMMGFEVIEARGPSIAVKPKSQKKGSPAHQVVDLDLLLKEKGSERAKVLKELADCELPARSAAQLKSASDVNGLLQALDDRVSRFTPQPIERGAIVLRPTEERRRSGSHYTPRELTEPMVRTTLRPFMERHGGLPDPDALLDLRICDPAMGSAAFLVGACRYLGDQLVLAWQRTGTTPAIPPDEDTQLYARRLVAQRCLFGVDRNPHAVQLAKLSLWLVTLAREHPFTFLDHALRCGDSLVGLTRRQIECFHWKPGASPTLWAGKVADGVTTAVKAREGIERLADTDDTREKRRLLEEAEAAQRFVRLTGDAVIAAYFGAEKDKAREKRRGDHETLVSGAVGQPLDGSRLEAIAADMRAMEPPLIPFHWEVEFAEVFSRPNAGFDAIIGNPPFAGKNTLINGNPPRYLDWLQMVHDGAHGNADLVAHFFRRSHGLLREGGAFGLIATNTISQGDTRATGLRWLRQQGCTLFSARRRYKWPGAAAVVVSQVHGVRGEYSGGCELDGKRVEKITAFLFHAGGDEDPAPLPENEGKSFIGSYVLGMGFTFDDNNEEATPIAEMERLIRENPKNAEVIFPYIGGEEVNDSPTHAHRRYVINFGEMSEAEARAGWPELMRIVEEKVKPQRLKLGNNPDAVRRKKYWWHWGRYTPALYAAVAGMERVLVVARVGEALAFAFLSPRHVFSEQLVVCALSGASDFACLQSRIHEDWARFFGSSMKDDLRYTPSDCFEAFPFPAEQTTELATAGLAFYDSRARYLVDEDIGLTAAFNRLHEPHVTDQRVQLLRRRLEELDRAVLNAYGWTDIRPTCEFLLDYEEEDEDETQPSRRKKPWRYRWPDEIRDEVLARLLDLNRRRARGEDV